MLPIILGVIAGVAAIGGIGTGIHGGVKMHKAKNIMNDAKKRDEANLERQRRMNQCAISDMDDLGRLEMGIIHSFEKFSNAIELIQNRPLFAEIQFGNVTLPKLNLEEVKKSSIGAGVLISSITGSALGTAGGFAAAGGTTVAVTAFGAASTGVAISELSGVAATNATLAAIGGGSLATGGGGMALGSIILGSTAAGVGILVGGIIFEIVGSSIKGKADDSWKAMLQNEAKIDKICNYLANLSILSKEYFARLTTVNAIYSNKFSKMNDIINKHINENGRANWNDFTDNEKLIVENTVLLVNLLFNMCKVRIVNQSTESNGLNTINETEIEEWENKASDIIKEM